MKRFLVVLAVAAVAGATYVATAPGSQKAGPTLASLNKKLTVLTRKVKAQGVTIAALKKDDAGVRGFLATCLTTVYGVNEFGDPTTGVGYDYTATAGTTPPTPTTLTTALDGDSSATPGAFFQAVDASCVTPAGALRKAGALSEHRAALHAAAKP